MLFIKRGKSEHDPIGGINLDDIRNLFPGELIYFSEFGSRNGYSEVIIKCSKKRAANI
jgi:hypothetical protein